MVGHRGVEPRIQGLASQVFLLASSACPLTGTRDSMPASSSANPRQRDAGLVLQLGGPPVQTPAGAAAQRSDPPARRSPSSVAHGITEYLPEYLPWICSIRYRTFHPSRRNQQFTINSLDRKPWPHAPSTRIVTPNRTRPGDFTPNGEPFRTIAPPRSSHGKRGTADRMKLLCAYETSLCVHETNG